MRHRVNQTEWSHVGRSFFNNMVVLSRAFWVQDGFKNDEHFFNRNEHRKRVSETDVDRRVYICWC